MDRDKTIEWVAIWLGTVGAVCAVAWRAGWQPTPLFVIALAIGVAVGLYLVTQPRHK